MDLPDLWWGTEGALLEQPECPKHLPHALWRERLEGGMLRVCTSTLYR
jgi:hypothetical protein